MFSDPGAGLRRTKKGFVVNATSSLSVMGAPHSMPLEVLSFMIKFSPRSCIGKHFALIEIKVCTIFHPPQLKFVTDQNCSGLDYHAHQTILVFLPIRHRGFPELCHSATYQGTCAKLTPTSRTKALSLIHKVYYYKDGTGHYMPKDKCVFVV
jgi:hypothetical protein